MFKSTDIVVLKIHTIKAEIAFDEDGACNLQSLNPAQLNEESPEEGYLVCGSGNKCTHKIPIPAKKKLK